MDVDKGSPEKDNNVPPAYSRAELRGMEWERNASYIREQGAFVWGYVIGIAVGLSIAILIMWETKPHV